MCCVGELVEVFEAAVVGVDHLAGHVARARGTVEGHHHAGIVLVGVAFNVLARGAAHELLAGVVVGLDLDRFGPVEQHAIGNDLGFEAGGAKLLRDILGGLVIFRRGGHVRIRGERFKLFAGQAGVGNGKKLFFDRLLPIEALVAEYVLRRGDLGVKLPKSKWRSQQRRNQDGAVRRTRIHE